MGEVSAAIDSSTGKPGDQLLNPERVQVVRGCLKQLNEREAAVIHGLLSAEPGPELCARLQIDSNDLRKAADSARAKLRNCVDPPVRIGDVPDDPERLGGWLEGHLVGLELGNLTTELAAVHQRAGDDKSSLGDILGEQRSELLEDGLSTLSAGQMRRILQTPRLLMELQELILSEGGSYWVQLAGSAETDVNAIEGVWSRLQPAMGAPAPDSTDTVATAKAAWYRPWLVSVVTAVFVLIGVQLARQTGQPAGDAEVGTQGGWDWAQPEALPENVAAGEYLTALADGAGAWFNQRPETAPELARRISELRQGCTTLLLADHRALSRSDRDWLLTECRAWAQALDEHLAAVEAGEDVLTVRSAADETVNSLMDALRERAAREK
jgi:hypothetical protein